MRPQRLELGMLTLHVREDVGHAAARGHIDGLRRALRPIARLREEQHGHVHVDGPRNCLYARRVHESNSEYEQTPLPAAPGAADAFATEPDLEPVEAAPPPIDSRCGLLVWLLLLVVFGVGGVLTGQSELALLVAMSGIFVAAQAADLDERWSLFYHLVAWVVPVGGAAMYVTMG